MTTITETLAVSALTVIQKLKEFDFKTNQNCLPVHTWLRMNTTLCKGK